MAFYSPPPRTTRDLKIRAALIAVVMVAFAIACVAQGHPERAVVVVIVGLLLIGFDALMLRLYRRIRAWREARTM